MKYFIGMYWDDDQEIWKLFTRELHTDRQKLDRLLENYKTMGYDTMVKTMTLSKPKKPGKK